MPAHRFEKIRKVVQGALLLVGSNLLLVGLITLIMGYRWHSPAWHADIPAAVRPAMPESLIARSHFTPEESLRCGRCHASEFEQWRDSQHARANRLVSPAYDAPAFRPSRQPLAKELRTEIRQTGDQLIVEQTGTSGQKSVHPAAAVIGVSPLTQYLTLFPGGRFQVVDPAYDPAKDEWFTVFPGDERGPEDWGYWKNRGMNWNSQCAACHMTEFQKNYDIAGDKYQSTWKAMGISCSQCHGPMEQHLKTPKAPVAKMSSDQVMSNCASCHSRREELTGRFKPGDDYDDHYRLTLPDQSEIYYADGQVSGENFEYASFIGSRMGHTGVKCSDCHNPHSGQLRLPVENNALCMSCHTPPGSRGAKSIANPTAHSHHTSEAGNRCVDCHMPQTTYMARDRRRDHGFTIPDPRLTVEFGIPNACNRCHTDKTAEWSAKWVEKWYGSKMDRPSRERARLVAAVRSGNPAALDRIPSFVQKEPVAAWRASLISLLQGTTPDAKLQGFLRDYTKDQSPLVRAAALSVLADSSSAGPDLAAGETDQKRLVRITSAWAQIQRRTTPAPAAHAEILAWLDNQSDQPVGALHQAELALAEGRAAAAGPWLQKATQWDPSPEMARAAAHLYYGAGDLENARQEFRKTAAAEPRNAAVHYSLALLESEMQNPSEALRLLRLTVELDPLLGRAWYNLGLAESASGNVPAACAGLRRAEKLLPHDPSPPYALATILLRTGDRAGALAAAYRALAIAPEMPEARLLVKRLGSPP